MNTMVFTDSAESVVKLGIELARFLRVPHVFFESNNVSLIFDRQTRECLALRVL
jgi:hypothetical protein